MSPTDLRAPADVVAPTPDRTTYPSPPPGGAPVPGVVVRGGPGGTRAHVEDLGAAAAALDRAAAHLEHAANRCSMLAHLVEEAYPWSPATAGAARGSLEPLVSPRSGVAARAADARTTAAALRTTADLYSRTDRDVTGLMRSGLVVAGSVIGESGPLIWAATATAGAISAARVASGVVMLRLLRYTPGPLGFVLRTLSSPARQRSAGLSGAVARTLGGPGLLPRSLGWPSAKTLEVALPGAAAFLRAALPGRTAPSPHPVRAAAGILATGAAAATALLGTPTNGVVVTPVMRGTPQRTSPPRDTADLLEGARTAYPKSQGGQGRALPGSLMLTRLDHADGTRSWVAFAPGTQEWDPVAGSNPFDLPSDLEEISQGRSGAAEALVQSLTFAGVQPDEPVALVGHSLGGLVAMEVATDPAVQERFTISLVVTAGSPVGDVQGSLAPEALAVHYEHTQDLVPATDGTANPDDPQRVTITVNPNQVPWGPGPAAHIDPVEAHALQGAIDAARELEGSADPSLRATQDAVRGILGDGTATATTTTYQATRVTTDVREVDGVRAQPPWCVP